MESKLAIMNLCLRTLHFGDITTAKYILEFPHLHLSLHTLKNPAIYKKKIIF